MAEIVAEECTEKLGSDVEIDTMVPLHAFDAGGRSRALLTIITALAQAKAAELNPGDVNAALNLVNWEKTSRNDKEKWNRYAGSRSRIDNSPRVEIGANRCRLQPIFARAWSSGEPFTLEEPVQEMIFR